MYSTEPLVELGSNAHRRHHWREQYKQVDALCHNLRRVIGEGSLSRTAQSTVSTGTTTNANLSSSVPFNQYANVNNLNVNAMGAGTVSNGVTAASQ
jgi:hypothetical protein